jgi:hypothetical protein
MDDNQLLDELWQLQKLIMELRHKISLRIAKKPKVKDEVEQAFDECAETDDETADQETLVP